MKIKTKDLSLFISFIIINILLPFPLHMLNVNSESVFWFIVVAVLAIADVTIYCFMLTLDTKLVPLVSLFPILVIIICYLLGYNEVGGMIILLSFTNLIFFLVRIKEYYHIFFTEVYVTEREKRDLEKAKEKENNKSYKIDNHQNEFSFNSSNNNIEEETKSSKLSSEEKGEKRIMLGDIPCTIYYPLRLNKPLKQLITIGDFDNIDTGEEKNIYDICTDFIGDDDTASYEFSIFENHVFVDKFSIDDNWYFDINDLESVTVESEYEEFCMQIFILKFKDGTEETFGSFDLEDDISNFISIVKSINPNVKFYNKDLFDPGTSYKIENNILKINLIKRREDDDVDPIDVNLLDVKKTIINGRDVILTMNNDNICELKDVDRDTISILRNK